MSISPDEILKAAEARKRARSPFARPAETDRCPYSGLVCTRRWRALSRRSNASATRATRTATCSR